MIPDNINFALFLISAKQEKFINNSKIRKLTLRRVKVSFVTVLNVAGVLLESESSAL